MLPLDSIPSLVASTPLKAGVQTAFGAATSDPADSLKAKGYSANDIAAAVKNTFHGNAVAAAQLLKNDGFATDEIVPTISNTWNGATDEIANALNALGIVAADTLPADLYNELHPVSSAPSESIAQETADAFKKLL